MKKAKQAARANLQNTRKSLRKQKRQQKKVHRQEHYLKKKTLKDQPQYVAGRFVKRPADNPDPVKKDVKKKTLKDEPQNAAGRFVKRQIEDLSPVKEIKKKKTNSQPIALDVVQKERLKEKKEVDLLKSQMEEQRRKTFLEANEEEDKTIKKLEKQLGLNKIKNKKNLFLDDGLDYLLEICDRSTTEQIVAAEKHLANVEAESDFEEDLAVVTGKKIKKPKKTKTKSDNEDVDSSIDDDEDDMDKGNSDVDRDTDMDEDMSDSGSLKKGEMLSDGEVRDRDDSDHGNSSDVSAQDHDMVLTDRFNMMNSDNNPNDIDDIEDLDVSNGFSDSDSGENDDESDKVTSKEKPDVWEDIYGRKRDKEGNVIKEEKGAYIPPHLRNKDSTSDQALIQLKRQIKSVLNKLGHTNLHWASASMEALYSSNSRHSVSSALGALWLEAAGGAGRTPARLAAEHAALVATLHANVGNEIGAHFLEELCTIFDNLMQKPQPMADKTLDNIVCCLAYLYSFKIYHATLLYDVLRRLLSDLTEKNIDCVMVVFRCAGAALRKDEPQALKEFIHDAQARAARLDEHAEAGSRIKFLLEVLMAVKNNNLNKIPNYDPSFVEELKKSIRGIVRKGNYVTPLNITLEDLLKAESRGKWWVVGSAWEGGGPPAARAPPAHDHALLELARTQRMNTDVRKSIFCVIMSAEDYMDAYEKLQHLGLKGQQEREIVHVLLACCLNEKKYNPYYSVLGLHLCNVDRKYQLAFRFAVWDKIKDLENMSRLSVKNLAQFMTELIVGNGLQLSVLKVIEFSDLNRITVRFLRQILLSISMNADPEAALKVYQRVAKAPKLHTFREGLRLFIKHFFLKHTGKSVVLTEKEMAMLKSRTAEVERILTMYDSKLQF